MYATRLLAQALSYEVSPKFGPEVGNDHPDGICLDAEGAVWYTDVGTKRCVRVREGGEMLQSIDLDRGCFACMLGA
jgi:sugar lactone lactonase YvrE